MGCWLKDRYFLKNKIISIEQLLQSKYSDPKRTEDLIVFNEHFVAVFDGTSALHHTTYEAKTIGQLIVGSARDFLLTVKPDITSGQFLSQLSDHINKIKLELGIFEMRHTGGLVFCVYSKNKHEIWQLGDCQALTKNRDFLQPFKIEKILSSFRSAFLEAKLVQGSTVKELLKSDPSIPMINKFLTAQQNFANSSNRYGYSVVNGDPVSLSHFKIHKLSLTEKEIVLASDGYPEIFLSLEESENHLLHLTEKDPLCIHEILSPKGKYPGQISYDDRAYIRFRLTPTV